MTLTQAIICSLAVLNGAVWGFYFGMKFAKRGFQKAKDLAFKQGELGAWEESTRRLKEAMQ